MQRLALVLALVSVALATWAAIEVSSLRDEVRAQAPAGPAVRPETPRVVAEPIVRPPASDEASPPVLAGSGPARSGDLPGRLAALEARLEKQEAGLAAVRERAEAGAVPMPAGNFIGDPNTAQRRLKMDERQRAGLDRVLEDMRQQLDRLHDTPNDEGTTWKEASKIVWQGSGDGDGVIAFGLGGLAKLEKFKASKVPGTNETFGDADRRIRREAKDRARGLLTPEQQKTFDEAVTDPLFGGMGDGISFAITSVSSEDGDGGD